VVGQPIDHRRGHLVVGENRAPFRKLEVRGDDETPPFVAVGDDPEQEMRALLIDRHVAPFVNDQKLRFQDRGEHFLQRSI